jgi:beta-ribofuranosylaminobenzene 5'-phosphate synthase
LDTVVTVTAPARLHLGFLDLNGAAGRKFGSIGLAIDSHRTIVEARFCQADERHVLAEHLRAKVDSLIALFCHHFADVISPQSSPVQISIPQSIPEHAGLGSGTQLAIAIGTALSRLYNIEADTPTIAAILDRGSRSGIGISAFDLGGFIVDGGLGLNSNVPPLLVRHTYPENWRVVLIMERTRQGVHGKAETEAFHTLPTFPLAESQTICHLTLMTLLPALIERDIALFGQSITEIQRLIGDHFSQVQGGRYTSPAIAQLLVQAQELGHTGIAQSSWGPTGCVFVDSDDAALALTKHLENTIMDHFDNKTDYSIITTRANSTGAVIDLIKQ